MSAVSNKARKINSFLNIKAIEIVDKIVWLLINRVLTYIINIYSPCDQLNIRKKFGAMVFCVLRVRSERVLAFLLKSSVLRYEVLCNVACCEGNVPYS
jgi:hypothetical protein